MYMLIYNCALKFVIVLTHSETQLASSVSEWMQKIFYHNLGSK